MRINVAIPEPHVTAPVLDASLEAVTRLNEALLEQGQAPVFDPDSPGVRWKPEPPGQEHFDHAAIVHGRGWGDCDDLAPWHAASLRVTGEDPGARAVVRKSGPQRWHAVVRRSDGSIDDPSLDAGMPGPGRRVGVHGAVMPVMFAHPRVSGVNGAYIARPQLALRPVSSRGGQVEAWQARTDLPWHWQPGESPGDIAMASLHASPVSDQALVGALRGAVQLGEASGYAHPDHLDRLDAIADCLEGCDWEDLADEYGEEDANAAAEIVGSFFGSLKKAIKNPVKAVSRGVRHVVKHPTQSLYTAATLPFGGRKVVRKLAPIAMPVAQKALPFVPGVGPVAAQALEMASPTLQRMIAHGGYLPPEARIPSPSAPWGAAAAAPGYGPQCPPMPPWMNPMAWGGGYGFG